MDNNIENDENLIENCTPPEITEIAKTATLNLLPKKSNGGRSKNFATSATMFV